MGNWKSLSHVDDVSRREAPKKKGEKSKKSGKERGKEEKRKEEEKEKKKEEKAKGKKNNIPESSGKLCFTTMIFSLQFYIIFDFAFSFVNFQFTFLYVWFSFFLCGFSVYHFPSQLFGLSFTHIESVKEK